jgi:glycosyltransferase involved in cell wall biosynthesis
MRVAHFVQRYPPALGGSEAYFARLGRYLATRGDVVTVFTTHAIDLENFFTTRGRRVPAGIRQEQGVEVRRYSLRHFPLQPYVLKALSLLPLPHVKALTLPWNPIAWDMWTAAGRAEEKFDLVHATAFPYGWPLACARRLADRLGVPFVLTPFLHLGDSGDSRDRTRRAYLSCPLVQLARRADRLFVQTEGERQALVDCGVAPERIILQGMGVDLPSCTGGDRRRARTAWGCNRDEAVVGHLANNSRDKGTIDLLRAANIAWRRGGRFTIVLAGPEMPVFRSFWRGYGPVGPVHRLGVLDERGKRDFFAGIDLFALPSRSDSFGIVLLEAWANGVPNLVYRAGGPAWLVRHGMDGLQARCGDLDELAVELLRLTGDAGLRRKLGEAGRDRKGEFQWEDKLELVRRVYGELVGERRGLSPTV